MRNLRLTLQYNGGHYLGWQIQPQGPSIQGVLQGILREILHEPVVLQGAGRTDSGVHALGQVAHVRTSHPIEVKILKRALNAQLPGDIAVLDLAEVPLEFDSQRDAKAKTYSYFILNSETRIPFLAPFTWRVYGDFDLDAMHRCLEMLVGEHDFAAFKAADSMTKTSLRKILSAGLQSLPLSDFGKTLSHFFGLDGMVIPGMAIKNPEDEKNQPRLLAMHLKGQGFLKHMVRNILGTLVDVGKGRTSVEEFRRIFDSKDRTQAGMTSPPQGLFLVKIDY